MVACKWVHVNFNDKLEQKQQQQIKHPCATSHKGYKFDISIENVVNQT